MRYVIYKDNEQINVIESGSDFVSLYCEENGYTYKESPLPMPEEPEPKPTPGDDTSVWDELDAAYQEGVNSAYDE